MKSIRTVLTATLLAGGALLAAAASFSIASAADASAVDTADVSTTTPPLPPGGPREDAHGFGPGHLFRKLGLTAEQQASIKAIMTAARPQMKTLHEQMQANRQKLMLTKPDDPAYGNVVAEVAQSNATLASQRTSQGSEVFRQMYAVLTPAQKTQLATLEAQWAAQPHEHRWGGPGRGRGPNGGSPPPEAE